MPNLSKGLCFFWNNIDILLQMTKNSGIQIVTFITYNTSVEHHVIFIFDMVTKYLQEEKTPCFLQESFGASTGRETAMHRAG